MKKILVATHGTVASGIKSVAEILLRDSSAITAVDCYMDESDFTPRIQAWIDEVSPEDDAVIFTDLVGGSVCSKVMQMHPDERGIVHVAGFNVAAVLECLVTSDALTPESVRGTIRAAQELMQVVEVDTSAPADDGDDFFA